MSEIFFSPITQVLENEPPTTIVAGQPGKGKTFALVNMAAACLEQGAHVFVLDAKNDMLVLKNIYPNMKTTDVNKIASGSLDPFLVFKDVDTSIILTITEILCGKLDSPQKLAITPIIKDYVKRAKSGNASFRDYADYLYQNQNTDAQLVGNQLLLHADTKYGGLIFGKIGHNSRGISFARTESRIISILGMSLPSGSSDPKPDEMMSAATVYIICKMLKNIMVSEKKKDKAPVVIFFDECHILMHSNAIKDIIDEIAVLGRSLGISIVLASQNVSHFDKNIAQLVATKIAFRLSKKEAQEFFDLFNNTTEENELDTSECISLCAKLKIGYCFLIDRKGRCALTHVVSPYDTGDITSNPLFKKER